MVRTFCQHGKLTKSQAVAKTIAFLQKQQPDVEMTSERQADFVTIMENLCVDRFVSRASTTTTGHSFV
jgi:hypothetical protein